MTAAEPEVTLAPLSSLLAQVAEELEREVVPHLAGDPWIAATEAVEQLRAIVRVREARLGQLATVVLDDGLPDYCEQAACQNLASQTLGGHRVCGGCALSICAAAAAMLGIPRVSTTGGGPSAPDDECGSCGMGEGFEDACSASKRACGHHCNHSLTHDGCDWCGTSWGENGAVVNAGGVTS